MWADNITYTLTITSVDNINGGSGYAAYDGDRTTNAVCTTDANKKMSVVWTTSNIMQQNADMQFKKNSGCLFNKTNLGTVTNIEINSSAGSYSKSYGTTQHPSSGAYYIW